MKHSILAFALSLTAASNTLAAISETDATQLGKSLTPLGAEKAGNADGSIPAWDPKSIPIPNNFVPGSDNYVSPFANEKPLYTINNDNYNQHNANLTDGTVALLKKLGSDGFLVNVFPSKRAYETPNWFSKNTKRNATSAELVDDGQRIVNNYPGTPFPIPKSGLEVLWNHMVRYVEPQTQEYDVYYVGQNGKPVLSTTAFGASQYPIFENPDEPVGDKNWSELRINYEAPARRAGEILLVHEPGADYTKGKGRKAWQYLKGQRRVRLAPAVAFDTPNPAVAGTSTYDDFSLWNGSPERYNWKLLGKKEIIIPYSNYEFLFEKDVLDLLKPKFIDPQYTRWEKHRVWVVEGTLKDGQRHLYAKRRYYIDEDSWVAHAGETYDSKGNLWRVHYMYSAKLYDRQSSFFAAYVTYDLLQNIYSLNGKPIPGKFKNGTVKGSKYFTPKGMARSGVR